MPDYEDVPPLLGGGDAMGPRIVFGNPLLQQMAQEQQAQQERPPTRTREVSGRVRFTTLGERVAMPCDDIDVVTVQLDSTTESAVFPTFTQKVSNDGFTWFALAGAATVAGAGITVAVTVTGYTFYAFELTTVGSGSGYGLVTIRGKSNS